jgi:hypothetical protein
MVIDGPSGPPDAGDGPPDRRPERGHSAESADRNVSPQDPPETRSRHRYYGELVSARPYEMVNFGSLMTARAAVDRPEWQTLLSRGEVDRCGGGVIDERGKRFSPPERRIAEYLARHGPAVVSVSEGYGVYGRTPDARVNDIPVEFKSLDPGASDRTVKAALNSAKGQVRLAVIDARGSGLAEDVANRGIRRFSGTPHGDRLDAVLVIGDNYNIDWRRTG